MPAEEQFVVLCVAPACAVCRWLVCVADEKGRFVAEPNGAERSRSEPANKEMNCNARRKQWTHFSIPAGTACRSCRSICTARKEPLGRVSLEFALALPVAIIRSEWRLNIAQLVVSLLVERPTEQTERTGLKTTPQGCT